MPFFKTQFSKMGFHLLSKCRNRLGRFKGKCRGAASDEDLDKENRTILKLSVLTN